MTEFSEVRTVGIGAHTRKQLGKSIKWKINKDAHGDTTFIGNSPPGGRLRRLQASGGGRGSMRKDMKWR
jgi:hypothetical protein